MAFGTLYVIYYIYKDFNIYTLRIHVDLTMSYCVGE